MSQVRGSIEALYRSEAGRVLATLVRLLGDLDLAEEALHEAFAVALETWPRTGLPEKPRPWLVSTARFKAIDVLRRRARFDEVQAELVARLEPEGALDDGEIADDRLRLIFTCCHPALPPEARVALTLREVCGLTTEEIARAFLLAQLQPSPVVQLNRAVAVAACDGPEAGLAQIQEVLEQGGLANYHLAHAAQADMYRRLGQHAQAHAAYERALELAQQEPERQFLQGRLQELGNLFLSGCRFPVCRTD